MSVLVFVKLCVYLSAFVIQPMFLNPERLAHLYSNSTLAHHPNVYQLRCVKTEQRPAWLVALEVSFLKDCHQCWHLCWKLVDRIENQVLSWELFFFKLMIRCHSIKSALKVDTSTICLWIVSDLFTKGCSVSSSCLVFSALQPLPVQWTIWRLLT